MTAASCRLLECEIRGWQALVLENDQLNVTVLPTKGADIYAIVYRPLNLDLLMKTPWGLQPPGAAPRLGSGDAEFLWNYEGGWQELFPSVNETCEYGGTRFPFHGEVATRAWEAEVMLDTADEVAIRLSVQCAHAPFELQRIMRLRRDSPSLLISSQVTNLSTTPAFFVWGQHCVLGAPFIADGCRLDTPAHTIVTPAETYEQTARLTPGQRSPWPLAQLRAGGTVDLRQVPGPAARSHDDVFLTDLDDGWVAVVNPHLDLTFRLEWDPAVFRWIVAWQPYGGALAEPLTGTYGLGIEPWVTPHNLAQAVEAGDALCLAGGASLETTLSATVSAGHGSPATKTAARIA